MPDCEEHRQVVYGRTARSLKFWSLSDINPLSGYTLREIDLYVLTSAQVNLNSSYNKAIEQFSSNPQIFPNNSDQKGISIKVDNVHDFINYPITSSEGDEYIMIINIPIVKKNTFGSHFFDMANIRLDEDIRVWIDGVTTKSGDLIINITHTGDEIIVDQSNNSFYFSHAPITSTFKYNISTKQILLASKYDNYNDNYAKVGPFTNWHISVSSGYNEGLDMTSVTSVEIEFRGTFYSFTL